MKKVKIAAAVEGKSSRTLLIQAEETRSRSWKISACGRKERIKPMGKTLEYQGYTIQSSPQHLAEGEKWQLRIFVSVDDHRGVKTREFSADVVYATEQE